MKCWYDGILHLRKGDLVEISKAYEEVYNGYDLRVNEFTVLSTMAQHNSSFDTNKLSGPITGRVIRSIVKHETKNTFFEIEEGYFEDNVFVKAGELKKGQDALKDIFAHVAKNKPQIFLFENVPPLKGDNILTLYVKKMEKLGYSVKSCIVRYCDYGASTARRRLIVFGTKVGKSETFFKLRKTQFPSIGIL